jgi:hypothetical protein
MGYHGTKKIGKYGLIGKPKSISERVRLAKKMRSNALKRNEQNYSKLIEEVERVVRETGEKSLFDKKQFLEKKLKERKQVTKELRQPGVVQKLRRGSMKKGGKNV